MNIVLNDCCLSFPGCHESDPLNVAIPDVALEKSLHGIGAVEVEYKRKVIIFHDYISKL